jgi:Zn-dependent protease
MTSTGKTVSQLASWVAIAVNIGVIGMEINAWLAFFNLIPWGNFDGFKVFHWNKKVWIGVFIGSIVLYLLTYFIQYAFSGV